jgi:hypothetical protein
MVKYMPETSLQSSGRAVADALKIMYPEGAPNLDGSEPKNFRQQLKDYYSPAMALIENTEEELRDLARQLIEFHPEEGEV